MPQTMNPLHLTRAPVSDPSKVMEMIHAAGTNLSSLMGSRTGHVGHDSSSRSGVSHLKLHVDPEAEQQQTWSNPQSVSAHQVEQLVQHVRQRQRELDQREADLQAGVFRLEQQSTTSQVQLRKRALELEQHLGQIKLQQAQLIKLQQNMIETQTTLRKVIERIVSNSEPGQLKQELLKLKFELGESLDSIISRWERIKIQLE
jgi:SMC interacting uncharacterized protein involved in chromosome segregation